MTDYEKQQAELTQDHLFHLTMDHPGKKHILTLALIRKPSGVRVPVSEDGVFPFLAFTFDEAGAALDVDGPGFGNVSILEAEPNDPESPASALFLELLDGQEELERERLEQ